MYQRRKVLLALIEIFGGTLSTIDCYKLMFLFCRFSKKDFYDFFPYKFGAYSFILHQDKLRLTALNHLHEQEAFQVTSSSKFLSALDTITRNQLHTFVKEIGALRGNSLIKKTYLEYPHFAIKSQIANKLLSKSEYDLVRQSQNPDTSPYLFTIGYEGISIDHYIDKLVSNNVVLLIDVRRNPISQKYGFSKNQLRRYVESSQIDYVHIPELGIPSKLRTNLDSEEAYQELFSLYQAEILPQQKTSLEIVKNLTEKKKRVALTCFEALPSHCHRHEITNYFEQLDSFDTPIKHL